MIVSDIMTVKVTTCKRDQTVHDAAKLMLEGGYSVIPIVGDKSEIIGIVTEHDFVGKGVQIPHGLGEVMGLLGELYLNEGNIERIYEQARGKQLGEVMQSNPSTVSKSTTVNDLVNLMSTNDIKHVPVVEDGKVVGIVTRRDLLKAFLKNK